MMFDKTERDMIVALNEMERVSRMRTNFDKPAAREVFKQYLDADRRFDGFDKEALVKRVQECLSCGATLKLDDPRLRGLEPRPLERSRW
jgi:hypothetical protein